ncbi:hypothetical protein CLV24_103194 [Pontibacter ummariensis]|uniref:Uncharacterized protein n=1 Tax=Pontibacter ummariensis TaxID=1610492 RepID=A0A239CKU4_9BACT|nr:hypothetical protein CLV24_103194 [Pontibacter ummariensis]SNS20795.1 hypothetical protein SAMN06296052_103119 [Pontibacter ummariensis]
MFQKFICRQPLVLQKTLRRGTGGSYHGIRVHEG